MKCPNASMPEAIAALARDPRGYPIFFAIQQPGGAYDFKGITAPQMARCARERLCGICGRPLGYWLVFVGGVQSCANRIFTDPPMHQECAEYAFAVCPYLMRGGWDRSHVKAAKEAEVVNPAGNFTKPTRHGIYRTRRYEFGTNRQGYPLFLAAPAKDIIWRGEEVAAQAHPPAAPRREN